MGQMLSFTDLRSQLEADRKLYCDNRSSKEAHERLLHTLQTNDCREILTAAVNGDDLANVFVLAGYRGHVDVLEALLNHGMSIDVKDENGYTALMYASNYDHEKCLRLLHEHVASVDGEDNYDFTATHSGFTYVVEILLAKSANPNVQNNKGMTVLMFASERNSKEIVQLLLNHNVDIDLKNDEGQTALDLAKNQDIKEMLFNHVNNKYVLK